MALLMVSHGGYKNQGSIANGIRYITRTRTNEDRKTDLLAYGAVGASHLPEAAIEQFKIVQKKFRVPGNIGKYIFHETLQLNEGDLILLNNDARHIVAYANRCAYYYYHLGFQVVFAVHWDQDKKYHIHFVGNAVSYIDGHKWQGSYTGIREGQFIYCLNWYSKAFVEPTTNYINPISFEHFPIQQFNNRLTIHNRRFYAVANGKKCGIYEDYYDCQSQIENYKNSKWKQFSSLDAAYVYLLQELDYRDYYEIHIRGFRRWFLEYHSFLNFLNIFKDRYELIFHEI